MSKKKTTKKCERPLREDWRASDLTGEYLAGAGVSGGNAPGLGWSMGLSVYNTTDPDFVLARLFTSWDECSWSDPLGEHWAAYVEECLAESEDENGNRDPEAEPMIEIGDSTEIESLYVECEYESVPLWHVLRRENYEDAVIEIILGWDWEYDPALDEETDDEEEEMRRYKERCRQTIKTRRDIAGDDHPLTLEVVDELINLLDHEGEDAEEIAILRKEFKRSKRIVGTHE
jgi:hypothetical protein